MADVSDRPRLRQASCAHRRCTRVPTQAHDVFSWFAPQEQQTPAHYEVCDRHARYFQGAFGREQSIAIERDLVEHATAEKTRIEPGQTLVAARPTPPPVARLRSWFC